MTEYSVNEAFSMVGTSLGRTSKEQQGMSSESFSLDVFTNGHEFLRRLEDRDRLEEKIMDMLEACDSCQGFQFITDAVNGFAAISSDIKL